MLLQELPVLTGSCWEICAACIISGEPGQKLNEKYCVLREQKLNQDSRAIAYYEMLHSAGMELAFTALQKKTKLKQEAVIFYHGCQ